MHTFVLFLLTVLSILVVGWGAVKAMNTIFPPKKGLKEPTPGDMAEDRLRVAKAEAEIAEIQVKTERHMWMRDRVLDARQDGSPLPELERVTGEVVGEPKKGHPFRFDR